METLLYVGVVHAAFIILFLAAKPGSTVSDRIIICWMTFLGLPMISTLVSPDMLDIPIPLLKNELPFALTFGPLLLLYTHTVTGHTRWSTPTCMLHACPFVLGCTFKLLYVPEVNFNPNLDLHNTAQGNVLSVTILASTLGYSGTVLWYLKRHQSELLDHFSAISRELTLRWLKWLTIGLASSSLLPFIAIALQLPELLHSRVFALIALMLLLSFFGLKQTEIFLAGTLGKTLITRGKPDDKAVAFTKQITQARTTEKTSANEKPVSTQKKDKYQRSGITEPKAKSILPSLLCHMENDKPYLDANFTVERLARNMNLPRHHLTLILSELLDKNFYVFVNEYRVREVITLMNEESDSTTTLLEMAFQSGFNSKSTFNKAFKTVTGKTPSQYRKARTDTRLSAR